EKAGEQRYRDELAAIATFVLHGYGTELPDRPTPPTLPSPSRGGGKRRASEAAPSPSRGNRPPVEERPMGGGDVPGCESGHLRLPRATSPPRSCRAGSGRGAR